MHVRHRRGLVLIAAVALFASACSATTAESEPAGAVEIEQVGAVAADADLGALLPADLRDAGLRVVTSAPYPPYEQFDENNELVGLDIDLAHAIAATLGVGVSVESVDFDGVVPAMQAGRYDVAMAGMEDTAERRELLSFIDYAAIGSAMVVPAANPHAVASFADLCGLAVGIERGTSFGDIVAERAGECPADAPIEVSVQDSQASALLAITSGTIDALLTQNTSGSLIADAQPDKFVSVPDGAEPDGLSGIAVLKDDAELAEAIFQATQRLGDDGVLAKIFDKWGIADVAVIPTTMNAGPN